MQDILEFLLVLVKVVWNALLAYAKTSEGMEALNDVLYEAESLANRDFNRDGMVGEPARGASGPSGIGGDPGAFVAVERPLGVPSEEWGA